MKKDSLIVLHKYLGSEPFGFKPRKQDLVRVLEKASHLKEALEELKHVVQNEVSKIVPRKYVYKYNLSNEAFMISAEDARDLLESVVVVKSIPIDKGKSWIFNLQSLENPRHVTVLYMIHDDEFLFVVDRNAGLNQPLLDFN